MTGAPVDDLEKQSPMQQNQRAGQGQTWRVLVVEDHDVSRHLLEKNLIYWGYEVMPVADGESAMGVLAGEDPPALALIDWVMPGMSGLDICKSVREQAGRPYIYLILLTALGTRKDVMSGLEAGADDYVIKPFEPDELRARLKVGQRIVNLERKLASQVCALEEALCHVKRLKGLIPICMYCKRIRDDHDYWRQIEDYLHSETGTNFSHGICPECFAKVEAGLDPLAIT
jgi:CheY-like chemotaxis protein